MIYKLSNGEEVNLIGNLATAKFLMFVFPRLDNVCFVDDKVPHIVMDESVRKLWEIRKKIDANRELNAKIARARQDLINEWAYDEFDDEIPF